MGVFLTLGILSVGFYVVLLLALFVDGRKSGKHRVHLYHQLELGRGSATDFANASDKPAASQHRLPPMDDVIWIPVTKMRWIGKEANRGSNLDGAIEFATRTQSVAQSNSR